MMEFKHRKVQFLNGGSLWISLPAEWTRSEDVKKGDIIRVYLRDDGHALIIKPAVRRPQDD